MPYSKQRRVVLSALVGCAALGGPVASAQASNATLRTTLTSYNARIDRDEARVLNGVATYEQHHNAKPLIRALRREVTDIHRLDARLARESASTPKGRKGKREILRGLKLIASAYGALATDIQHASSGQPLSQAAVKATVAKDKKGRADFLKGARLLG